MGASARAFERERYLASRVGIATGTIRFELGQLGIRRKELSQISRGLEKGPIDAPRSLVLQTTQEQIDPTLLDLLPTLARLAPPAAIVDKTRYSAFVDSRLRQHLLDRGADGLLITGSETDVCVLATVLSAVDLGYPVTLVTDGVCSPSDEGHEAVLQVYRGRYNQQINTTSAEAILRLWR